MSTSNNKRIFYPAHSIAIKSNGGALTWTTGHLVHGAQSAGMTTNISLTPVNELGHIELYENSEDLPDVEMQLTKVLDGHPLAYHLATTAATSPTLVGRSNARCDIGLAVFPDTNNYASGTPLSIVALSGMYINSVGYNMSKDGPFTEETSYVGNDKIWTRAPGTATGTPNYGESDLKTMPTITYNAYMPASDAPRATLGVAKSDSFMFNLPTGSLTVDSNGAVNHPDVTVFPTEIFGISLSGTNPKSNGIDFDAHVNSFSVNVSFNRETITELGRRGPYHRSITFPVDVTSEFAVTATEGDLVSVTENGIFGTGAGVCSALGENARDRTIRIALCEGTRIYLGRKNKIQTVNYTGGDAGGVNVEVTYGYFTQNILTVMHQNDPHVSGATWWANRESNGYLVE